jgi:hypothetical protein
MAYEINFQTSATTNKKSLGALVFAGFALK